MKTLPILAIAFVAVSTAPTLQAPCDLQGDWELVSAKYNNQGAPPTFTSLKMFSKTHFAVVGDDKALRGPVFTAAEALNFFYNGVIAVAGTYTVSGSTWTEKIEHSSHPEIVGLSLPFQCQHEGDRLIQKGTVPIFSAGKKTGDLALEEVYRRVGP